MSSNHSQEPELTINQRRDLITSIRPNGKIRPIPAGSTAEISFENIHPGNDMTNFHDEYAHGRYYRKENFLKMMQYNPINPQTREPINEFKHYIASIDGNTGGRNFAEKTVMHIDLDNEELEFHKVEEEENLPIQEYEEYRVVNPTKPFHTFISKYIEETAQYLDELPINDYFAFFGIRDSETSFLLKPIRIFMDEDREVVLFPSNQNSTSNTSPYAYLTQTLTSLLQDSNGRTFEVIKKEPYSENLALPYPSDIIQTPLEQNRFAREWKNIKVNIYNDIVFLYKNWLRDHPEQFEAYRKFQLTPEMIELTTKVKSEINELAREQANKWKENQAWMRRAARRAQKQREREENNDRYANYYNKFGGRRKTRRVRKVSKKTLRKK